MPAMRKSGISYVFWTKHDWMSTDVLQIIPDWRYKTVMTKVFL